jgi:uncharacterized membrane protein
MLPREIVTEHDPERSRFDLPTRQIGALRFIGLVPMLFSIGFVWMPGKQMLQSLAELIAGNGSGFNWFFVVFLSVFVIAGMIPFGLGLFILAGRTRVTVSKDRMVMTELAGPIRWSRKVKLEQVERLEIGGASRVSEGGQSPFGNAMCGIVAILKDGKKMPIAIGYPRDLLQPLVAEISSLMQRRGKAVPVAEATLPAHDESQAVATEPRVEKPAGSAIELSATGWSAEFKVPSRGLFKGSYGLLIFGVFWCAIVGAITAAGLFGKGPSGSLLGMFGFLSIFWAVGIGMLLIGIHLGTRRWTLRADHSELRVTLKSALRAREWHWAAGEIADIRIGDSGTKVNERMLEQLQILPRSGARKTGLLTDRAHEELAWIATTLRGMLRVQSSESPEAPPRVDPSRRQS